MSGIDRYIGRQLAIALVAVTGGLALLIWLTQSLRFVELVVNRGLSFAVFVRLTGLMIPSFVAVLLPITTFVVVLFVYQRLADDRELVVMRAAGLSPGALARPALAIAAVAAVLGWVLHIYIGPWSYGQFRDYQSEIRNRMAAVLLQDGVFTQVSDDITVYVRTRAPDGTLRGLFINDARDRADPATILAEAGTITPGATGPRVTLYNGSRQQIDHATGRLRILEFAENTLDLSQSRELEETRVRDSRERSISNLLNPDPGEPITARDVAKFRVEAHQRLSGPLTGISFALVALTVTLTGVFRRQGGFVRPLVGVAMLVGLLVLGLAAGNLATRVPALLPLVWVQAVLPGALAGFLLFAPPAMQPGWARA